MAEMTIDEFLFKCSDIYPFDTKDPDKITRLMSEYKTTITNEMAKTRKQYNLEKLLEKIKTTYKFKTMPGTQFITELLPKAVIVRPDFITGEGKVLVCITGNPREDGTWEYKEKNWVLSAHGGGRYVGDVLNEERTKNKFCRQFEFPPNSGCIDHDKAKRQFSIYVPTDKLGELGYPIEERRVFFEY